MMSQQGFDFTYDTYENLVIKLIDEEDFQAKHYNKPIDNNTLLIRHDVDWSPRKAIKIGQIEKNYGISSTYFFFLASPFYNSFNKETRNIIQDLYKMGHEIGLHFSTHQYWSEPPTPEVLEAKVREEMKALELVSERSIDIVSFHNPPEWIFKQSFKSFISTYESKFFEEITYCADSNQRWRKENPFCGKVTKPLQVLTHPVLWGKKDAFTTDRLREERDYLLNRITTNLEETNREWDGVWGIRDI